MVSRNGLDSRKNEKKISTIIGFLFSFYILLAFLAPLLMEKGTVPELSGRANAIDYATEKSWGNLDHGEDAKMGHEQPKYGVFAWSELNPIWAFTYMIGDINCHQKYERSWEINDNQMPICTRDVGILFGIILGCLIFRNRGCNRWTIRDTFLTIIPDSKLSIIYKNDLRMMAMFSLIIASIIPIGIDGFLQLLTDYESTNFKRVLTGSIAGFSLGWLICSMLTAKPEYFDNSEKVTLPLGSLLKIK
ncbi:MAG: DUF2085 domain-containing protein [Candidatus Thalassarchaeaceae archaeon]